MSTILEESRLHLFYLFVMFFEVFEFWGFWVDFVMFFSWRKAGRLAAGGQVHSAFVCPTSPNFQCIFLSNPSQLESINSVLTYFVFLQMSVKYFSTLAEYAIIINGKVILKHRNIKHRKPSFARTLLIWLKGVFVGLCLIAFECKSKPLLLWLYEDKGYIGFIRTMDTYILVFFRAS